MLTDDCIWENSSTATVNSSILIHLLRLVLKITNGSPAVTCGISLWQNKLLAIHFVCSCNVLFFANMMYLYITWEFLSVCPLSPLKRRDVLRRNLACSRMPSVCRSWVGSYVDRGHHWEGNEHFIQFTEGKQNTTCWVPYSLHCAMCQHFNLQYVYRCRQWIDQGACSTIGIQQDGAGSDNLWLETTHLLAAWRLARQLMFLSSTFFIYWLIGWLVGWFRP